MATNTTFDTLVQDITRYVERGASLSSDPTVFDQIPRLINQSERKIMNALKLLGTQEALTDPTGLPVGVSVIDKPDRWRSTISMFYGSAAGKNSRKELFRRPLEYCRAYWPDATVTDPNFPPEFYADYTLQHYLIVPTPDQTYPIELVAYLQPPYLDTTNQTNFWTTFAPVALLKCCLRETAEFLKDWSAVQEFEASWEFEMSTLDNQDLQRILDRGAKVERP